MIEPEVADRLREMVRLRAALEPAFGARLISADVLVVSAERFDYWHETPNTVFYTAEREGRLYEQVA